MKLRCVIVAVIAAVGVCAHGGGAPQASGWENVGAANVESVQDMRLTVTVKGDCLYVTTPRAETVKVFTILGQQIASQNLAAGTWRLRLRARGIYIVKTDGQTRRVTL